eukprot:10281092-Alexandrium_andersonii.AAC.1
MSSPSLHPRGRGAPSASPATRRRPPKRPSSGALGGNSGGTWAASADTPVNAAEAPVPAALLLHPETS